jgi:hypothetical protein
MSHFMKEKFYQISGGFGEDVAIRIFSYKDLEATEAEISADGFFNDAAPVAPVKFDQILIVGSDTTAPVWNYVSSADAGDDIKITAYA